MSSHAILSPSGASRWLACTPSARLELQFPDNAGAAASEGTLAHSLGELLLRKATGGFKLSFDAKTNNKEYAKLLAAIKADKQYDASMQEHAEGYATYVLEQFAQAQTHTKDAVLKLEQKLDLTEFVPEGFGTGDSIIIADKWLTIIDLKYGKGVPVSATQNRQMMLYALGALMEFEHLYDIANVRMTIYQPRLDSISTYEMAVVDLKAWAETELKPRAKLAFDGNGEFQPGTHCRFCKARGLCKANAAYNLEIAKHEFKEPVLLDDHAITDILNRADQFVKWLKGVTDYALAEATVNGKKWPDYKLVEGRSNRAFVDETKVAEKLIESGLDESAIYTKKLLTITALESLLTKAVFQTTLDGLIIKPPGKPALVPASDKRPELNSVSAAVNDFALVELDD